MLRKRISLAMLLCAAVTIQSAGCVNGPKTFHANTRIPDATFCRHDGGTLTIQTVQSRLPKDSGLLLASRSVGWNSAAQPLMNAEGR